MTETVQRRQWRRLLEQSFQRAMASACELLLEVDERALTGYLLDLVANEAQRIEQKYRRYRGGNIVRRINHAGGQPVVVDEERPAYSIMPSISTGSG